MPIRPNPLENLLFFTLNQGPAPLLDLWSAVAFRAVAAAVRLGVFDALADAPLTGDELAQKTGLHPQGCAVLTAALASLGYFTPQGARLALSPMAKKWLTAQSQTNFAPYSPFGIRCCGSCITTWKDPCKPEQRPRTCMNGSKAGRKLRGTSSKR